MKRPDFKNINSGAEFNQWYWLKEQITAFEILLKQTESAYDWPNKMMVSVSTL